jgi:nitrite reductase (NADH) small subunit
VGNIPDFPEDSWRAVRIDGREIGVFNIEGRIYGLPNICPRQTGPLYEGRTRPVPSSPARRTTEGFVLDYHFPTGMCPAFSNINLCTYPR